MFAEKLKTSSHCLIALGLWLKVKTLKLSLHNKYIGITRLSYLAISYYFIKFTSSIYIGRYIDNVLEILLNLCRNLCIYGGHECFFKLSATLHLFGPWPSIFSDYSFWVHHLVNLDDQHLLALAMASDFSVAWQCLSKRTIVFFVTDQTPRRNSTSFICYCSPRPVINARAMNCQAHHFHCRKNSYLFPNEVSFYVFRKEVSYNSEKSFN
jgi:hypothetical protein